MTDERGRQKGDATTTHPVLRPERSSTSPAEVAGRMGTGAEFP